MAVAERSEYKGNPVLVIKRDEDDKYPFTFGLAKARLIVECFGAIKSFVAEADTKKEK